MWNPLLNCTSRDSSDLTHAGVVPLVQTVPRWQGLSKGRLVSFSAHVQGHEVLFRGVSEEELAAVVARVDAAEREGTLERWAQEDAPTAVIPEGHEPQPGAIEARRHWPELDATMLLLSNGMKVGATTFAH